MDKQELEKRLKDCEDLRIAHLQDALEIMYVMEGLKKQIAEFTE